MVPYVFNCEPAFHVKVCGLYNVMNFGMKVQLNTTLPNSSTNKISFMPTDTRLDQVHICILAQSYTNFCNIN